MNKVLSLLKFQSNLDAELDYVCSNAKNKIIIKRRKRNFIIVSEESYNLLLNNLRLVSEEANTQSPK
jgi:PHD/YefM family antitoxin component YafN of YafNO toxin-antitoxin module